MTEQQILEAKGEVLDRLAGEVLQNGTHHWYCGFCLNCSDKQDGNESDNCSTTRPISCTDWNEAIKRRDWAVETFGSEAFLDALEEVAGKENALPNKLHNRAAVTSITVVLGQPHHYIKACMICVIRAREKENNPDKMGPADNVYVYG